MTPKAVTSPELRTPLVVDCGAPLIGSVLPGVMRRRRFGVRRPGAALRLDFGLGEVQKSALRDAIQSVHRTQPCNHRMGAAKLLMAASSSAGRNGLAR